MQNAECKNCPKFIFLLENGYKISSDVENGSPHHYFYVIKSLCNPIIGLVNLRLLRCTYCRYSS